MDNQRVKDEAKAYFHSLSTAIDAARTRNGLNLQEFAEFMGVSTRALSNWRAGRAMPRDMEHVALVYLLASGRLRIEGGELEEGAEKQGQVEPSPFAQAYPAMGASLVREMKESRPAKPQLKEYAEQFGEALPIIWQSLQNTFPGLAPKMLGGLFNFLTSSAQRAVPPSVAQGQGTSQQPIELSNEAWMHLLGKFVQSMENLSKSDDGKDP